MIKRFLFILAAFIPMIMNAGKTNTEAPDFAFPQQVIKSADAMLDRALKAGDGQSVVVALVQSGLARTSISADSIPSVISRIEGVRAKEKDAVTGSLLDLLLAEIYSQYYSNDSYNLNQRPALADPGTDITLWSGTEFKDKVVSLYNSALSNADALKRAKITDFPALIDCDKTAAIFYPTLFDFASLRAVEGISGLSYETMRVLSPLFFYDFKLLVPNVMAKPSQQAIAIANDWVNANTGAPRIAALLSRCNLIDDFVVSDDDDENEAETTPLLRLYEENKGTPYAIELLLEDDTYPLNLKQETAFYKAYKEFELANPAYFRINAVKNELADLSRPSVSLTFPTQVARDKAFDINVVISNLSATELLVYRVKDSKIGFDKSEYTLDDCDQTPLLRLPVKTDGTIPFENRLGIPCKLSDYGIYVVSTSLKAEGDRGKWLPAIYCSDMALMDTYGDDSMTVYTVDGTTGAPVTDASVTTYERNRSEWNKLRTHTTGADGAVSLNKGNLRSVLVKAEKGKDTFGYPLSEYLGIRYNGEKNTAAFIRPALAIYHPGDTLDFVAVAYDYNGSSRELAKNRDFKVMLRNPNYIAVDTIDIRTDDFGRASARFNIPEEGLTGNFTICLLDKDLKRQCASVNVMVSDYKLPTFEAVVDSVTVNDADGSVTVLGKAMTYSGFPVQNATVEASLAAMQRVWWRLNSVVFHSDTLTTGADGSFRWVLTPEVLEQTPFAGGRYKVDFIVTSPSGENRFASDTFSLSKKAYIIINTGKYLKAETAANVAVDVYNPVGQTIDASLLLTFEDAAGREYKIDAVCRNGRTLADLSPLHSGEYRLTVTATDIDATEAEADVTIYNAADNICPVADGLWAPSNTVNVKQSDRKAEIIYGAAMDQPHVLMTLYDGDRLIEQRWIDARKGMNTLTVNLPASAENLTVQLSAISGYKSWTQKFAIKVDDPDATLNVKVEHMRDHITPLSPETVTVKVTNGAGKGVGAAVILDMYSKALDNLATQSWRFSPSSGYQPSVCFGNNIVGSGRINFYQTEKYLSVNSLDEPEFNFYGMSWTGPVYASARLYGSALSIRGASSNKMAKMESAADDGMVEEEMAVADLAAPAMGIDTGASLSLNEVVTVAADGGASAKAEEQYRPSEVPLAFFAPMLSTDAGGDVTYSFTVPNANTTWVLNALAYNDALATGLDLREVIASKPVMVEPNMPRFLRTGDEARIVASVMNATDEAVSVTTLFEIIDPATGDVIDTQSVDSQIDPRTSATVTFSLPAPAEEGALMVRVKSSTATYSDGVQTIIPVLASSQPVVDASTFYLAPEQKEMTRDIPAAAADTKVTLSFCENPTWEVVSALPGLRSDDASTSLAASAQVFAAAVSGYVMQLNPAIEPALKEWLASAKDAGEMLSMLNRNDDLKQLVLAATPWVQEARSDEERITRLALLFDRKEIDRSIASGVKKLEKMQRSSGGWSWTDNYDQPSEWVTMLILNNFAELRQLGCAPRQLDAMVRKALVYVDAQVAKNYARYPDGDYSYYTYVRSLYGDVPMSTGAQKAYNASLQKTIKNWKKSSTAAKAADALVLYRNDYKQVASQILSSIREFATSTPQLGMWWDSVDGSSWHSLTAVGQTAFILQAFNTIEPGCEDIDKIRQWLILNKITQDWGNSVDASACVAAILQCGSSWLNRPGDAVVTIDGQRVETDRIDRLTGQIIAAVPDAKGELKITRTADSPAWGAILSQSTQVMKDVKAHSIPELSVTKELFVKTDAGWAPANEFTVGQVVKVRLVMKATRDMDYVTLVDNRAATFEPVIQTPRPVYCDGLVFYLENRDAATNLFIDRMPKGQYVIEYEMNVNNAGTYASGIATIQSQYAPEMTAHSAGLSLSVE